MASVKIKNVDRLLKRLTNIANTDVYDTMVDATKAVHAQAKELVPVDKGDLQGSIHMSVKKSENGVSGKVYTNKEYAPYVEFGTGVTGNGTYPYDIEGLNLTYKDKGWSYYDEETQEYVYTNGQVAQPYMYPALKNNEKYIKNLFKTEVKDKIRSHCKGGK